MGGISVVGVTLLLGVVMRVFKTKEESGERVRARSSSSTFLRFSSLLLLFFEEPWSSSLVLAEFSCNSSPPIVGRGEILRDRLRVRSGDKESRARGVRSGERRRALIRGLRR